MLERGLARGARSARSLAAVAAVLATVAACGTDAGDGDAGPSGPRFGDTAVGAGDGDTTCSNDADCGVGGTCNPTTKACACGGVSVEAGLVSSNLLVVLDRSCSMKNIVVGTTTKWDIAVAALTKLVSSNGGKIRFGLELFPDTTGDRCTQDAITIPVADGAAAGISSLLGAALDSSHPHYPSGPCVTNIDTAIQAAATEPAFSDATRKNVVVLVTDGKQAGCTAGGGDKGTTTAIRGLRASGVDTFVVGFGAGVDVAQLDEWADEGGQPRGAASPRFFDAADQAGLDAVLSTIAQRTLSCTLKLAAPPPENDAGLVYVFADGSTVPLARDPSHADGWDYDVADGSVTFYGATCRSMQEGVTTKVKVVFGCPGGPPPAAPVQ